MGAIRAHRPFLIILLAYLLLAALYSVVTPIFEASDELWHYPMIKYLADNRLMLPIQDPANPGLMRQEGSQPPLYYMLGAVLTSWIDTSDLPDVRHLNPHPDLGVTRPDGNLNILVHDPSREAFPWHGAVLAIHLARFLSVILGAVTVLMAYLLALELFPGRRAVALGAATLTAFNPMFLFISGSVNNDNLSTALASVLLWQIVRLVRRDHAPSLRELIGIGIVAGCGMIAKFNIGFMLPLVALSLAIIAYRTRRIRPFLVGALITGGLTILIGAWWYVRNASIYGDPTGLNIFLKIVGEREIPANLPQLWSERHTFLMSYWGLFGGVNVPLPDVLYTLFNGVALLSVVGLVIAAVRRPQLDRNLLLGRAFTVIWSIVLFISLIRWTQSTWASQGRLMFAAIAPISLWMAVGLLGLGDVFRVVRWRVLAVSAAYFLSVSALSLLLIDRTYSDPAFAPGIPPFKASAATVELATFTEPTAPGQSLRLGLCCDLPTEVHPGEYLTFDVVFDADSWLPSPTEWSVFIHLVNRSGLIVWQRDVLLRQGLWSTRVMNLRGERWRNRFSIQIPDGAYAPDALSIRLGLYNNAVPTERMRATAAPGDDPVIISDNAVQVGTVRLLPRSAASAVPNPTVVNFGDQIELVGYDVSTLSAFPGDSVTVTLYWRAKTRLSIDYSAFVHILNRDTTEIFGGADGLPNPSSGWQPGAIIEDRHTFTLSDKAPPGMWQIETGLYDYANGEFKRLRIVTPDGGQARNYVDLSRFRIGARP